MPDVEAGETRYAIEIPAGLSILAYGDPNAEVAGLDDFTRDRSAGRPDRPPGVSDHGRMRDGDDDGRRSGGRFVPGGGRSVPDGRLFLRGVLLPARWGCVAIEAGWVVTEVGRQPWIIHGVMRTSEAVTPIDGALGSMLVYTGALPLPRRHRRPAPAGTSSDTARDAEELAVEAEATDP